MLRRCACRRADARAALGACELSRAAENVVSAGASSTATSRSRLSCSQPQTAWICGASLNGYLLLELGTARLPNLSTSQVTESSKLVCASHAPARSPVLNATG